MWDRVLTVLRAGFASSWASGAWPVASLVAHGTVAAVLCGLTAGTLSWFGYGVFALSVSGALIALPLLGDVGALLRADPAAEWIESLPVTRLELRLARTALILFSIAILSLAALLPAAWFAPDAAGWGGRAALVAAGLGQALFLAAFLLALQSALGERAEALLVLLQTLLFAGIVLGFVVGLRFVPRLAHLEPPPGPGLALYPPTWFAAALAPSVKVAFWPWRALPWLATAVSLATLAVCPLPRAPRARTGGGWMATALGPLRTLANRVWVRTDERASFDLVFYALPLEREFVLRTYPMVGIPLAFLIAGAGEPSPGAREALLAVLLFMPAAYLPILLVHVPATASFEARWLFDTAPVPLEAHAGGAIKAVALRFLVPLYGMLFLLAWSQAGLAFALRLGPPAALIAMILLRRLYPRFVRDPPLSVSPSEIESKTDWAGVLAGLGLGLTLLAILASTLVRTFGAGLALTVALLAVELVSNRDHSSTRRRPASGFRAER